MIQKINEKQNILGDNIGFVENWDFSRANLNEENRILAITQVASICYQNPKALGSESLYNRLAAESQGLPSSSFEFVPVLLDTHKDRHKEILYDSHILSNIYKYGEEIANKYILTNYRAIYYDYEQKIKEIKEYYNSTVASPENDINYHEDLKILKERYLGLFNTEEECEIIKEHFKVFLFKVDFPTRSQMVRHRVCWQELCISGESKITTLQGKRTIKELYENQFRKSANKLPKVRTYDFNEKRLVWSEIKEVFSTGKKPVFEVVIQTGVKGNKLRIKATENHKFLTLDGWKELKDISVSGFVATNGIFILDNIDELRRITLEMINNKVTKSDYAKQFNISELALVKRLQKINMIYSDISFEITNYHLKSWCLENKQKMIEIGKNFKEMAEHFNINKNTLSKWFRRHNIIYSKEEILLLKKPSWNKGITGENSHSYGKILSDKSREKISQKLAKPLGETALGFRFRIHSYWMADFRRSKILETFNNKCARCQTEDLSNVELDHIKPVRLYPNLAFEESNIQPLCKKCHIEKTLEENELNNHTYTFNFVESITLIGEEDTYDLEVEHPDHNYVANGIIVHNSRRYVSAKRVPFEYYVSEKLKGFSAEIGEESYDAEPIKTSIEDLIKYNENMYYALLDAGVKPQEARRIIPQAAYTQIWGAFQPKQLDNYFKLRLDEHSQWEIRQTAIAMKELIEVK
jgi:5-methylcytosine-specific restriction endonuclease McrA